MFLAAVICCWHNGIFPLGGSGTQNMEHRQSREALWNATPMSPLATENKLSIEEDQSPSNISLSLSIFVAW
jgi:hypothetical protein